MARIRSVKRAARRLLIAYGLLAFLSVGILAAFAVGLTDYLFRFQDLGWRVTGTTLVGAALLGAFLRFLYPSLGARYSNVQIARRIERRFPQLADRLSTAIAFLEHTPSEGYGGSPQLREATVDGAARAINELPLHRCLDKRVLRRSSLGLLAVVSLVAGSCVLDFEASARAARRLVLPFSDEAWPRRHELQFVRQPRRLAEGSAFEAEVVDRRGRLPERVILQVWAEGSGRESIQEKAMKPWGNRVLARLENVSHSFRYRAVGGDDDTMDWIPLEVVRPPHVTALRIRLVPPAYTRLPAESSGRHLRGWAGTRVEMSGRVDRPLRNVTVVAECGGKRQQVPGSVARDGRRFNLPASDESPWILQSSGTYRLELQDAGDFVSEVFAGSEVHVWEDTPPTVSLAAPAANSQFTANAIVPLRVVAKDDLAIRSIELERQDTRAELYRAPGSELPPPAGAPHKTARRGETRVLDYAWDLAGIPGLKPGDAVEFQLACCDDQPQYGRTGPIRLSIVSGEEILSQSDRRQASIADRLRAALSAQRTARRLSQSIESPLRETGKLSQDSLESLQNAELSQRRVGQTLDSPQEGAAALIAGALETLQSNRIDAPQVLDRLQRLRDDVGQLTTERLPKIQHELTQALKAAREALAADETPAALSPPVPAPALSIESITAAGRDQEDVIRRIEEMLATLSEWESTRRLAEDLAEIRGGQEQIAAETQALPTTGQDLTAISSQQRIDLQRLSQRQLDLARDFDRLQSRWVAMLEQARHADPQNAATTQSLQNLQRLGLGAQMRQSAGHVAANQVGQASLVQRTVLAGLDQLLNGLSSRPQGNAEKPATAEEISLLQQAIAEWLVQQVSLAQTVDQFDAAVGEDARRTVAVPQRELAEAVRGRARAPATPEVCRLGLERVGRPMADAAALLEQGADRSRVGEAQREALRRLQRLLDALAADSASATSSPDDSGSEPPASRERTRRVCLGELRVVRSLQLEINERTAELERQLRDAAASDDRALAELADDQSRLAEIIHRLIAAPAGEQSPPETPAAPGPSDTELDKALDKAGIPGFSEE